MLSSHAVANENPDPNMGNLSTWKVGDYIENVGTVTKVKKVGKKIEVEINGAHGEEISISLEENRDNK